MSIVAPSAFGTRGFANTVRVPTHDAYQNPSLVSVQYRAYLASLLAGTATVGDVERAAEKIFEFSKLDNPPMRWALGLSSIATAKAKAENILKETDDFAAWSEGLEEKDQ